MNRSRGRTAGKILLYLNHVLLFKLTKSFSFGRTTIWNLYTVPRIAEPVWLTMMACASEKNLLCQHFLKEFAVLIEQSSKNQWVILFCVAPLVWTGGLLQRYHFVSASYFYRFFAALLTAVLTYHLAWVPTVMPVDHLSISVSSEKHASPSVNMLAKSHPYNPLWAQLGQYKTLYLKSRWLLGMHKCLFILICYGTKSCGISHS